MAFDQRGIGWHPQRLVRGLDPARKVALLSDDSEMPYDLFLGIPVHKAPTVVEESGLTVDGWVPVNPLTLETDVSGRVRHRRRGQRWHSKGGRLLRRTSPGGRRSDQFSGTRWRHCLNL